MLSSCSAGLTEGFYAVTHIRLTDAEINSLIANWPSYYEPLLTSVRDLDLGIYHVQQNCWPIGLPVEDRPVVALIGDDTDKAVGPTGFHDETLRRLVRWADYAALSVGVRSQVPYAGAALLATSCRLKTLVIETRLEQAEAWIDWVTAANVQIRLISVISLGAQG